MRKVFNLVLSFIMATSLFAQTPTVFAQEPVEEKDSVVNTNGYDVISGVKSYKQKGSIVTFALNDGNNIRMSFLSDDIFRYYVDLSDSEFLDYAKPRHVSHEGKIVAQSDEDFIREHGVVPSISEENGKITISTDKMIVIVDKETSLLKVTKKNGTVVLEEAAPLMFNNKETIQSLIEKEDEYFYGGGTQNGRFSHKGEEIKIENTNNWVDGGVASPNPFYWSTKGYGIVRNTFEKGHYDFGKKLDGIVQTRHDESRFDTYIFIGDNPTDLLSRYTDVTGKPEEIPDYAFYLSHLNCYNRDAWKEVDAGTAGAKRIGSKYYIETNRNGVTTSGEILESLMPKGGNDDVTAKKQIDLHEEYDLPLGWFLPNDGYGCNYGQTDSFDGDIQELKAFTEFSNSKGIEVGLWTQANLWPEDINNPKKGERDIKKEVVEAGVRAIKTDVAWVGAGYSMALNGVMRGHEAITELSNSKAAIVSLDGWAGTQRYAGIWSGDQTGGQWEYIRFHIPTYITTGLSGNPYIGSDMDGIFGGRNPIIQTRDFQWKAFTPYMLDMDGWGSSQKNPWEFGEPYLSINRAYLKDKAEIMPYISTMSHYSAQTGVPLVRAMLFEEQNAYTLGKNTQYQYMWGDSILVAPIYQDTNMDSKGNDVRNNIYLPSTSDVWIDYLTKEQYHGGTVLNNFDAPLWKTPIFVKNGSIIPRYTENNNPSPISSTNPKGLDKSTRVVEVYPHGETQFNVFEDDGMTLNGSNINMLYESSVKDGVATLTLNKATGTYTNVISKRNHEIIFNVSQAPTSVSGKIGGLDVIYTEVSSLEEFESATGNVYFYNEAPEAIVSKYATEGSEYDVNKVTTRPQVLVKSTEKIDIFADDFEVSVHGFENSFDLDKNELNEALQTPKNLVEKEVTDSSFSVSWDEVNEATSYHLEIDGVVYNNITDFEYTLKDLKYDTTYKVRVRSSNQDGYSQWSEILEIQTEDNPYRNVPEGIIATFSQSNAYSGKPQDVVDGDISTQFHSQNNAIGAYFTMDLQKLYEIEALEYVPRQDNFGNGTLQQFELEASIDGKSWKTVYTVDGSNEWTYPSSTEELYTKKIEFTETFSARHLRIKINKSKGNFFTANEIFVYSTDATKGSIVGDVTNDGIIDDQDLKFFENYAGLRFGDSDFAGYVDSGDFNLDGVINAYDIAYVARQVNGGAKENNKQVKGSMILEASQSSAKKGDKVTYTLYGLNMEEVYAFGMELNLDDSIHETGSASASALTSYFTNFSKPRKHTYGDYDNYIEFSLVGEAKRLSGTGIISEFVVTFKEDAESTDLNIVKAQFVGSNLSTVNAITEDAPTLPETQKILGLSDIKAFKLENDLIKNDDGTYYKKVFQNSNALEVMMNGDKSDLAEFLWDTKPWDTDHAGQDIILPMDFIFELKNEEPVKKVKWYNRESSNGRVTAMSAKAYAGETVYDLGTINEARDIFEFDIPTGAELIDKVVFTPLSSNGQTSATHGNNVPSESNRMLSVREVEIITDSEIVVENLSIDMEDTIYLDGLTLVPVIVTPQNASNPLFDVKSSDDSIASIVKVSTEHDYKYYVKPHKVGTVTLTATSLSNVAITATKEVIITDEIDTSMLRASYNEALSLIKSLYTDASVATLDAKLAEVEALLENPTNTEDVILAAVQLEAVLQNLEFKGSDTSREDSTNLLDSSKMSILDYTNFADKDYAENILDGNDETIWHSSYQSSASLPVHVTVDLNDVVMLEQVDMLPRQNSRNGHIIHYRIETSLDGVDFTPIVQGDFEHNGNSLLNREVAKQVKFAPVKAQYVRFVALNTLGDTLDKYASIAELSFYGIPHEDVFAESITFEKDAYEVHIQDTHQLEAIVNPEDTNETLVWTSSDETIATVDQNGVVTAHQLGKAIITLSGQNVFGSVEITVIEVTLAHLESKVDEIETRLSNEAFVDTLHPSLLSALNSAIQEAQEILNDETLQDEDAIRSAYDKLMRSIHNLDYNVHFVKIQEYMDASLDGYDTSTTGDYKALISTAQAIELSMDNIDEILAMNESFEEAALKLVKLNRTKLETLLEAMRSLKLDKFTQETVENFESALEDAESTLETATTNVELDEAYDSIMTAFEALEVFVPEGGGSEQPGENGGSNGDNNGGSTGTEKPTTPDDKEETNDTNKPAEEGEKLPTTGSVSVLPIAGTMSILVAIFIFIKKRFTEINE